MARIEFSEALFEDFERFRAHLDDFGVSQAEAGARIRGILRALQVLRHNPEIGRPVAGGMRELVIGKKPTGYVALYRFIVELDVVLVLAARQYREGGYSTK